FADYTVTAEIVGYSHYKSGSGFGIFGRANTTDGKLTSGSSWLQVYTNPFTNTSDKTTSAAHGFTFTNATAASLSVKNANDVNTSFNDSYKNFQSRAESTTLVADFKGNTVKFWAEGGEVYSATVTNTQPGAIGIALVNAGDNAQNNWVVVKNIKVALNNVKAVATEPIDIYKVDTDVSPAIPMDAMTYVDLAEMMIKVNGTYILGSSLDLKVEDGVSGVEVSNGTIRAYEKGTYKLIATDVDGNKQVVYVVVKNPTDTKYEIYSEVFTENVLPEHWTSQLFKNTGAWVDLATIANYNGAGLKPWDQTVTSSTNGGGWYSYAFLTLDSSVVDAFTDYTIEMDIMGRTHNYGGPGLFGRATTENGKLSLNSSIIGAFNLAGGAESGNSGSTTRASSFIYGGNKSITKTADSTYWNLAYRSAYESSQNYVLKLDGNNVSFSSGNVANYEYNFTTTSQNKGKVGVMLAGAWDSDNLISYLILQNFTVSLNNAADDKPAAKEIKLYTVSDASPAIPMNAMTQVKVSDLIVNVNGKNYLGQQLTFTEIENYRGISISDGVITAYEKGVFPVRVTNEATGDTDTIYVVVKNRTDANWVIFSEKFGDEYANPTAFPDNWKSQYYLNQYAQYYDFSSGSKGSALVLPTGAKFTFGDYTTTASYTNPTIGTKYVTLTEGIVPF
ncbi:MAG: hypothetical protein J6S00_04685, partial [Clostridia bacterium]|nr:hypothetical protein [Clostridia bacterium]